MRKRRKIRIFPIVSNVMANEELLLKLFSYRKRNPAGLVVKKQYELYAKWYHSTVKERVTLVDFYGDYRKLGRMVGLPISARQAGASV